MVEKWTDNKLKITIEAYLSMLSKELKNQSYNKSDINRNLKVNLLKTRTKSSIEYRMQNISATLEELCLPYILGYKPARHIGTNVKDKIRNILDRVGHIDLKLFSSTQDLIELDIR